MTEAELDSKIAETMKTLSSDDLVGAIKKAWSNYSDDVKEEARKTKRKGEKLIVAVEREMDSYPCELYAYIMFDNSGDLRGWTIEHQQYWTGNSGPSSAISLDPTITYKDIEREIGNDLFEALDVAD
jgi:hypothetical protein